MPYNFFLEGTSKIALIPRSSYTIILKHLPISYQVTGHAMQSASTANSDVNSSATILDAQSESGGIRYRAAVQHAQEIAICALCICR